MLDIVTSQEEVFVVETTVEPRYRRQRCNVDKDIFGGNKARPPRQVDSERKGAFKSFKIEFSLLPFQKNMKKFYNFVLNCRTTDLRDGKAVEWRFKAPVTRTFLKVAVFKKVISS